MGSHAAASLLQTGIRLITTLTNFWPEFGGIGWYVDTILGDGNAPELFYSNPRVIAAYQTWVRSHDHEDFHALYTVREGCSVR